MNRLVLSIFAALIHFNLLGQMFPLSDHYIFNGLAINPAFAGCNDALSATISYRNQWVGFTDSPKSYTLSLHTPVHKDRIGLGVLIENNSIGIFRETNIMGNYAYRMELGDGKLSLGLGFGFTVHNMAWNDLIATDPDDEKLINNSSAAFLPSFSLGSYYYTKKYFIGISMPMFLSHELDESTGKYKIENDFSGSDYFLTGGYEFGISRNVKLLPSLLLKYNPDYAIQIDYNAMINFKDQLWLGAGYRTKNIMLGMIRLQIINQIRLAYSYAFDLGSMGKYRNGSHEIVLNYVFSYERKVTGPRQF